MLWPRQQVLPFLFRVRCGADLSVPKRVRVPPWPVCRVPYESHESVFVSLLSWNCYAPLRGRWPPISKINDCAPPERLSEGIVFGRILHSQAGIHTRHFCSRVRAFSITQVIGDAGMPSLYGSSTISFACDDALSGSMFWSASWPSS